MEGPLDSPTVRKVFADPLSEECVFSARGAQDILGEAPGVEVFCKPGVTETRGRVAQDLLGLLGVEAHVVAGDIYFARGMALKALEEEVESRWANRLIHHLRPLSPGRFEEVRRPAVNLVRGEAVEHFALKVEGLKICARERSLGLSDGEVEAIVSHLEALGRRELTDVELEVLAQTWSEHCKHKIFAATIDYSEEKGHPHKRLGPKQIHGLFKTYIEGVTREMGREDMLVSVFKDNAGIVRFDEHLHLCFKVETHNSPSALDPYGGALTGILGVNRDILGAGLGARPVANTDVFCFPPLELEQLCPGNLPGNVMGPRRILEGVHKGVEDGGNKSGIPTVAGAMLFDPSYAGKPLVFVGTVGVMPQSIRGLSTAHKRAQDGDMIYMVGGAGGGRWHPRGRL